MSIKECLLASAKVKQDSAEQLSEKAEQAAKMIADALQNGKKLMLCGNGGSAGDSQHLAAEFVATLDHTRPRPGLPAIALTTDTSFLTAYANDFGFEGVFARQVETLGQKGDILLAISTSGNSKNVLAAAKRAKELGIGVIAMTGQTGGGLAGLSDILIAVPSDITMHIQEGHIALGHAITAHVEQLIDSKN
ncbi:MAG: D-sedoheptulose-7-phosphate isomerase [Candidatus Puniceispirillaceae bacterium]